ncbi:MAG: transporter substrate binding protein [Microvirga sp.]|jgi:putative ABC transport system substrate-binding protein|nr:transporter substrate binding protein [Microvirga sp.]
MKRRAFLAALTLGWSPDSFAQQPTHVRRITLILGNSEDDPNGHERLKLFRDSMRETGWVDGQNATIKARWLAQNPDRALAHAKEVAQERPDVVVVNGTPGLSALKQLKTTVPTVFVVVNDPVGAGLVESLSKPGGNITGFSTFEPEIGGKWVETLAEAAPTIKRVGILFDPNYTGFAKLTLAIEATAPRFGVQTIAIEGRDGDAIEQGITRLTRQQNPGLIVLPTVPNSVERQRIFSVSLQHRLPAIYPFSFFAKEGGLIAYGFDNVDLFRRAAPYVARILNGENAGALPVQAPTKFELIVNLKSARAMGLTIPPTLLARADEVIE